MTGKQVLTGHGDERSFSGDSNVFHIFMGVWVIHRNGTSGRNRHAYGHMCIGIYGYGRLIVRIGSCDYGV